MRLLKSETVRAFTLVEVMIGVLVLSLGLLGIGAIIPVVVREQRVAADATLGKQIVEDVRAQLLSLPGFAPDLKMPTSQPAGRIAWDMWIADKNWSGPNDQPLNAYLWQSWRTNEINVATGDLTFVDPVDTRYTFKLPLAQRLWPSKSSQVVQILPAGADPYKPQFVWDVVGRRVDYGDQYARRYPDPNNPAAILGSPFYGKPDVIQLAIFVRRIDLSIRVPRKPGVTLYDVLAGTSAVSSNDVRFPVAFNPVTSTVMQNAGPNTVPARAQYSQPLTLNIDPSDDLQERDHLAIDLSTGASQALFKLASQPGQKLVDNLGNIYTVKGYDAEDANGPPNDEIIVTPKVPSWVQAANSGQPNALRQIVFTPQIPAAVDIVTITRPVAIQ
jgi:hypothetical protein